MTQLEKHTQAIKLLELIKTLDDRIYSHKANENALRYPELHSWIKQRIETDLNIKAKLLHFYNHKFKI